MLIFLKEKWHRFLPKAKIRNWIKTFKPKQGNWLVNKLFIGYIGENTRFPSENGASFSLCEKAGSLIKKRKLGDKKASIFIILML